MNKNIKINFYPIDFTLTGKEGDKIAGKSAAEMPAKYGNYYQLKVTRISRVLDQMNKEIFVCHTDLGVEIPEGYIGIIVPTENVCGTSLFSANGVTIINPGEKEEPINLLYRIHTDVYPLTYTVGDAIARLYIVETSNHESAFITYESTGVDRTEGMEGNPDEAEIGLTNKEESNV